MAKEGKKPQKQKKPSVPNKDGFSRASFLYQAAHVTKDPEVSRMYIRLMDLVTKRTVLKVSPHVKRSVCKSCDRLQQPGKTSMMTLEEEGKKSETLQIECVCGTTKRFPVGKNKDYIPFVDRKE
ncbi:RPR2 [Cyberlindnera jadinii]|uniref:RPR2 protein n=1 Tax=Cyberlindnera jadinii (strain ATCC 18201 / CBS 1600 / BCRC 20928 / JCM 3617 / NBRC 0987 / NRRL Y-1542) TaxID=983966 RepID=A0A0H5C4E1_CYBJN|nr:RPR2 [Cyberlindnera jadinii]